eukprot:gene9713-1918_t
MTKKVKKKRVLTPLTHLPIELISLVSSFLDSRSVHKLTITSKEFVSISKDNSNILQHIKRLKKQYFHNKVELDDIYLHECQTMGWLVFNYGQFLKENTDMTIPSDYHERLFFERFDDDDVGSSELQEGLTKVKLYHPKISEIFNPTNFDLFFGYYDTSEFQTYSRLFSYHLFEIAETISVYKNLFLFKKRKLNNLELKLFNLEKENYKGKSLVSEETFFDNFDKFFKFNTWRNLIRWDNFFLVGGSVLKCILADSFESQNSDIDFFFIGDDYLDYESTIFDMRLSAIELLDTDVYGDVKSLKDNKYKFENLFNDEMYIRNMHLKIDGKKLKLQFIWYDCEDTQTSMNPEKILNIFDIDCCQVGFDGKEVKCSFPFIQSVNTGTFLNYKFINSKENVMNFYPRTIKYMNRGFSLIHSKNFNTKLLEYLELNEKKEDKNIRDKYAGFLINNDSMDVCNQFIELFE